MFLQERERKVTGEVAVGSSKSGRREKNEGRRLQCREEMERGRRRAGVEEAEGRDSVEDHRQVPLLNASARNVEKSFHISEVFPATRQLVRSAALSW
jgi:hypothetical protein